MRVYARMLSATASLLLAAMFAAGTPADAQEFDQYGGWTGLQGTNTSGFFRTEKINGRYWLITPDNNVFWGMGPTTVQYNCTWCQRPQGMTYNTFNLNFQRNNPTGLPGWISSLHDRFASWGLNCEGGFSQDISEAGGRKIPETFRAYFFTSRHSSDGGNMVANGKFPDVFDEPTWTNSVNSFASLISSYKDDPWRMGHFLDNEVHWSYDGKTLPVAFFEQDASAPGKQYMVSTFLYDRYGGNISSLNSAWGTSYTSWDGAESTSMINSTVLPADDAAWPPRKTDKVAFLREVADKYYSTTTSVVRANDPNHLVFSERIGLFPGSFEPHFDDYNMQVWEKAGEYCDVVAINSYQDQAAFEAAYGYFGKVFRHAGKPIMITEWNRCGNDTICSYTQWSLPNQSCRAESVVQRMKDTWSLSVSDDPNDGSSAYYMMGMHWFQLYDMPPLGRTDGEDYNPGIVNNMDEPYLILTDSMADVNHQLYNVLANQATLVQLDRPVPVSPAGGQRSITPSMVFEWGPVSGAESYDVLISQSMSFPEDQCIIARDVTSTSYSPGPVLSSGVWFWCVRAKDAQGRGGPYSELERFTVEALDVQNTADAFGFETMTGWRSHQRGDSGGWGEVLARGDDSAVSAGSRSVRVDFTGFSKNRFIEQANLGAIEASKYPAGGAPVPPDPGTGTGPYTGYPLVFADDFSTGNADSWLFPVGGWSVSSYQYRQTDTSSWQLRTNAPGEFGNGEYAVDVKIVNAPDPTFWAGMMINRSHISHTPQDSGYLICMRENGNVLIHNVVHGLIYEAVGAVTDTSVYNRLHVVAEGATLSLYVNDTHLHTWTDPDPRYAGGGYFCLITGRASAMFDNVSVYSDSYEPMVFEGQDLTFGWDGGKLDYSQSAAFEFDVYPHRMLMQDQTPVPSTRYLRLRMVDEVGGTVIDQMIDPNGQLPIGAWSRVSIPMGTTPRADVSSLEFIVNNGDYLIPLEHRIRFNIDHMTPPSSVGSPAQPERPLPLSDTFDREHLETWHATSGEWGIANETLYGFGVREIPSLALVSDMSMDHGTLSATMQATSLQNNKRAWIVFGADQAAGSFYFAGLDAVAKVWEIGRYDGSTISVLSSTADQGISPDTNYDISVKVTSTGVELLSGGQTKVTYSGTGVPSGVVGVGMPYSHIAVEQFSMQRTPSMVSAVINEAILLADDSEQYTVTVEADDPDGNAAIGDMRAVLHNGDAWTGANGRGYLAWGRTDADITSIGGTWNIAGDASGGGRWGYRTDDWGSDTYITPVSASTSADGGKRTVTFTFTVKSEWASAADQRLRGLVRDGVGNESSWLQPTEGYDVVPTLSLGNIFDQPDETIVEIPCGIVTVGNDQFASAFYVEALDRSSAIRISSRTVPASAGDLVSLSGKIMTAYWGERVIVYPNLTTIGTARPIPDPVLMTGREVGGEPLTQYTPVVYGGTGLYNVGLLMTIVGKVTHSDATMRYFYVDDGSGRKDGSGYTGIRVSCAGLVTGNTINVAPADSYVVVTGILSTQVISGQVIPALRPRTSADLVILW